MCKRYDTEKEAADAQNTFDKKLKKLKKSQKSRRRKVASNKPNILGDDTRVSCRACFIVVHALLGMLGMLGHAYGYLAHPVCLFRTCAPNTYTGL